MSLTQRLTLVAAILGSAVVFLDSTVVNVALPAIADDLDAGLAEQQWVVEAYMLTLVAFMLVGGALGDQFGRRRVFTFGLAAFGIASVLCAVAPSVELLIGARGLQGVAGALLVPGSLALVANAFSGPARGGAVGAWTAWSGIATVIGPAGGGLLVDELSWRWIFWINVPFIVATLLMTRRVEESRDPESVPGFDLSGIALSALGLVGPVFALIEQPARGWGDPVVWLPLAGGALLFGAFLGRQRRAAHPLLDLRLFRVRNFSVANLVTFTVYAGLLSGLFFLPLFLQQTAGYTALEAGLATMPVSLMLFLLSPPVGRWAAANGPRVLMCAGPLAAGTGLLLMTRISPTAEFAAEVLPAITIFGLGLSLTVAPLTATVLDSVPGRQAGVASGINNGISRVAGLLAIAVLGAVVSASFSSAVDERLPRESLSPAAAQAVERVQERPLGALRTRRLDRVEAQRASAAVADASASAFHTGVAIAGALMMLGGLAAGIGIRNPRRRRPRPAPLAATAADCGHPAEVDLPEGPTAPAEPAGAPQ